MVLSIIFHKCLIPLKYVDFQWSSLYTLTNTFTEYPKQIQNHTSRQWCLWSFPRSVHNFGAFQCQRRWQKVNMCSPLASWTSCDQTLSQCMECSQVFADSLRGMWECDWYLYTTLPLLEPQQKGQCIELRFSCLQNMFKIVKIYTESTYKYTCKYVLWSKISIN